MKLVILDRDGVINEDSDNYIKSPSEWTPIPGSLEAIARLCSAGYHIYIATNQSGIGRGLFSEKTLQRIHDKMHEAVANAGGSIAGVYYCPHHPKQHCTCRKPAPGLLDLIAGDLKADISGIPFIGDSLKDLETASARKCIPLLVRTGKGAQYAPLLDQHQDPSIRSCRIYNDLASAVDSILSA